MQPWPRRRETRDEMKRKELLNLIDRATESEDKIVEGMTKDIVSALEWCGCSEEDRKKVEEQLMTISSESRDHSKLLGELRSKVMEKKKEVF